MYKRHARSLDVAASSMPVLTGRHHHPQPVSSHLHISHVCVIFIFISSTFSSLPFKILEIRRISTEEVEGREVVARALEGGTERDEWGGFGREEH